MRISSSFLLLLCASTTLATGTGVRIQLKHVDADANITAFERVRRAGVRLHQRLELLSGAAVPVTSWGYGEYIAEYSMGEPPQAVQGVIDINNALVWTQCMTCRPNCFSQNLDYYDFSISSTGRAVPCNSSLCVGDSDYEKQGCAGDHGGTCTLRQAYDDDLFDDWVLRREEFTLGSTKAGITFGCLTGTRSTQQMPLDGASGIIGLGYSDLSLVNQLGATRFSYCLTSFFTEYVSSSTLFIGPSAGLNGDTPVTSAEYEELGPSSPFYSLLVSGLSLGKAGLKIPHEALSRVVIDAGYPYTAFADAAYKELSREVSRQLGDSLVPSPLDWLEFCVSQVDVSSQVPPLVIHFGSEDLVLPPENYWAPVDTKLSCMLVIKSGSSMAPPMNQTTVIGTYMQQDMHVLYDLENQQISFQKADCHNI